MKVVTQKQKIVEVEQKIEEVDGEGLVKLLGKKVDILCMNYIYTGTLIGVNATCVLLDGKDAAIVYETGTWTDNKWKDAQKFGKNRYVQIAAIESFGESDK